MKGVFRKVLIAVSIGLALCQTPNESKIDCEPEGQADEGLCNTRGCNYLEVFDSPGVPWCYYPDNYGYSLDGAVTGTAQGVTANLARNSGIGSMYGSDFNDLLFEAEFQTEDRIRIKITPRNNPIPRFEVPITISGTGSKPANTLYELNTNQDANGFSFQVVRKSTGTVLFDTSLPGFVYEDQFIQIATKLPSMNLYGLGENEQNSYRHDMNWKTWAGYGRDQPPSGSANMYGVHPTYTVLEDDGNAHTVLFLNSAAQEWSTTPNPGFVYKTIGGILDIYIFLGPTPSDTNSQYSEAVGRYNLPPYWSLGFHLCRYGYNNLANMVTAVDRTAQYDIPQDAQWGDIDIMERQLDFTVDPVDFAGLPQYVRDLKASGIKFVTILDPCISIGETSYRPLDLGNQMDVWVKKSDGVTNAIGRVWPDDPTYFGDFSNPDTKTWWRTLVSEFHDTIEYDALWIDMNEPANFVTGDLFDNGCAVNNVNFPPYKTRAVGDQLADKTLCPDHQHYLGSHYDTHNLYGWSESDATLFGVQDATGQRGWVLSRSTFVGSGNWVAHWLGDNYSNWDNLFRSIIGTLQFNRFAIPHVGADICGFIGNTDEELCTRWHELGAFYPFSRNHNALGSIEQDPGAFGPAMAEATRKALNIRYRFLPYLYTLFFKHWTTGTTVARALWDEFPSDQNTWVIDRQFMWGSGLLISPVVEQGATTKSAYFPQARWYDISTWLTSGAITEQTTVGTYIDLSAPLDLIPLHVRGGTIFPLQLEARNTELSRGNPWMLLVALDETESAEGELFVDDGTSLDTVANNIYFYETFLATSGSLSNVVVNDQYPGMGGQFIDTIEVVGLQAASISSVTVNGQETTNFSYSNGRLSILNQNIPIDSVSVQFS